MPVLSAGRIHVTDTFFPENPSGFSWDPALKLTHIAAGRGVSPAQQQPGARFRDGRLGEPKIVSGINPNTHGMGSRWHTFLEAFCAISLGSSGCFFGMGRVRSAKGAQPIHAELLCRVDSSFRHQSTSGRASEVCRMAPFFRIKARPKGRTPRPREVARSNRPLFRRKVDFQRLFILTISPRRREVCRRSGEGVPPRVRKKQRGGANRAHRCRQA